MPRTRQLGDLRHEVLARTDTRNDPILSTSEVNRYINQSITKLYNKLVRARGDAYYAAAAVAVTVANSAEIALPTDFMKLLGARWIIDADNRQVLKRVELREWFNLQPRDGRSRGTDIYYTVMGPIISVMPIPAAVHNVGMLYIPHFTDLVADTDTFDGINGWEEYVVVDASVKVRVKREEDIRELVNERNDMEKEIHSLMGERDHAEPGKVIDVDMLRLYEIEWLMNA